MKKVFLSFLFLTFFLLVGCTKEKSFNCKIDIYNEVDEYKLIANYKIYYKNTEVLKIEKDEKYISDNEKTLEYFNEYKKLEHENLNNLYGEVLYNISDSENEVIIKSTIDIINDSYFKDKEELNYSYNGGTINYNFKESVETYEENMNNLKGNK